MHSSGSFLLTILARLRAYLDEPSADAKYSNDFCIRHLILPAMVDVTARLNHNQSNKIVARLAMSLVEGQQFYTLPPNVGELWRIARYHSTTGHILEDWRPRGEFHLRGPKWSIEGNVLSVRPFPEADSTEFELWYVPNGDFVPHYSSAGGTLKVDADGDLTVMALGTAAYGEVDRRDSAYVGGMLRLLPTSGGVIEERPIISVDHTTTPVEVTVRTPFTHATAGGSKPYEIAPPGFQSLYDAVAGAASIKLAMMRSVSEKKMKFLHLQYRSAMKTIGDNLSTMQARVGKSWDKNTIDRDWDPWFY